jgi:hypothetical protein
VEEYQTILNNICENLLGFDNRRKKECISSSTWEKTEERRRLKAKLCACHSFNTRRQCELQEKYTSLNKDVKVNARRDHREFLDSLAQEAQESAKKGNMRDLSDIVRKMTNTPMYCGVPVRDKAGSIITSVQGQLQRWRQHSEEVLT